MVLRELLAVFGLQFDDKGAKKAESALKGLTSQAEKLAGILSSGLLAAAAVAPFIGLAKLASNAEEELNRLNVAFEGNAQDVVAWSDATAKAVGRSRFELRTFAGDLGVVLRGMDVTTKAAAKMSTELAGLAVDFASLANKTDAEVLNAFRSAITGETEAIKTLGIVINETALQHFQLSRGITQSIKKMNPAEKAALRYEFIMKKAAFALGDAAKTSLQWAGATKRLRGVLLDVGTTMGLEFLPLAADMVNKISGLVVGFRDMAEGSNIFKAALIAMAGVATIALLPLLGFLPIVAVFAALVLVIDEIITTFEGGDTVIRDFMNLMRDFKLGEIEGIGPAMTFALEAVDMLAEAFGRFMTVVQTGISGLISGDFKDFDAAWGLIWEDTKDIVSVAVDSWVDAVKAGLSSIAGLAAATLKNLIPDVVQAGFRRAGQFVGVTQIPNIGPSDLNRGSISRGRDFVTAPQTGTVGGLGRGALAPGAGGAGGVSFTQGDTRLEVSITQQPGESGEDLVGRLRSSIQSVLEERDQAILDGLVQRAGT